MSKQQEELCINCRGMPKLAGYSICFHCLAHFRRAHRRRQYVMFGIVFLFSPGLFVVYIVLILQAYLSHELFAWFVIIAFPMFFLWLIFGQKLRLPSVPRLPSQTFQYCIYCGKKLITGVDENFCSNCGAKKERKIR